jgi:hypothetical protein
MNQELMDMARQAGFETQLRKGKILGFDRDGDYTEELEAFAALVAAAERKSIVERCAYICEEEGQTYQYSFTPAKARIANMAATQCGTKIKNYFKIWYGIKEITE